MKAGCSIHGFCRFEGCPTCEEAERTERSYDHPDRSRGERMIYPGGRPPLRHNLVLVQQLIEAYKSGKGRPASRPFSDHVDEGGNFIVPLEPHPDYNDEERQRHIEREGEKNDLAEARRKR